MDYARKALIDDLEEMERADLEDTAYDYDVEFEADYSDEELREAIICAYDAIYSN